jgi:hypothetical protein
MKNTTVIQIRIIDPRGNKVSASERIDQNDHSPVTQAFFSYCEKHKGEFPQGCEFMLAGEGVW